MSFTYTNIDADNLCYLHYFQGYLSQFNVQLTLQA